MIMITGRAVEPVSAIPLPRSGSGTSLTPRTKRRFSGQTWSPGGTCSPALHSPADTDTDNATIRSQWKTNFRQFHDFGVKYIDTHCHLDFLFSRERFDVRTCIVSLCCFIMIFKMTIAKNSSVIKI